MEKKLLENSQNEEIQDILELVINTIKISSLNMIKINQYLSKIRKLDPKQGNYLSGKYYLIQALHKPDMTTYFEIGLYYLKKASELNHPEASIILEEIRNGVTYE